MTSTSVEFDVEMTCESCVNKIKSAVCNLKGVENIDIFLDTGKVIVHSSLPSSLIQDCIESTGRRAVLKGYGSAKGESKISEAAVATLGSNNGYGVGVVRGIIRFAQLNSNTCIIEGTVDGLTPGEHGLHVHECGDITEGCKSVGDHLNLRNTKHGGPADDENQRHTGDLGNIKAENNGRATFRLIDKVINIYDIIGRSIVVTARKDDLGRGISPTSQIDGNAGERLACGIISRSAGLFENSKTICACDGLTLWDERDKPSTFKPAISVKSPASSLCVYI